MSSKCTVGIFKGNFLVNSKREILVETKWRLAWYGGDEPPTIKVVRCCAAHGYQLPCRLCEQEGVGADESVADSLTARAAMVAEAYGPESGVPAGLMRMMVGELLWEAHEWRMKAC